MVDVRKTEKIVEGAFILLTLVLTFLDFFDLLPADVVIFTKIMGMSGLAYVFYKLSFMRIFFGKKPEQHITHSSHLKNLVLDVLILACFFSFTISDFLAVVSDVGDGSVVFRESISFIGMHAQEIQKFLFIAAGFLLMALSVYLGTRVRFERPSFLSLIHEDEFPKSRRDKLKRAISVFLSLCAFFILYFSLVAEWFSLAVDTPLALLGFFAAIVIIRNRHYSIVKGVQAIESSGEFVSRFFEEELPEMFRTRKVFYILSGLLALQLFTELFNFVMPFALSQGSGYYLMGIFGHRYMAGDVRPQLMFPSLASLFSQDSVYAAGIMDTASLIWVYFCLLLSLCMFIGVPLLIWWKSLKGQGLRVGMVALSVYAGAIAVYFLKSFFRMEPIRDRAVSGIYFMFVRNQDFPKNITAVALVSLLVIVAVYVFSQKQRTFRLLRSAAFLPVLFFMTKYVFLFSSSVFIYYTAMIRSLIISQEYFICAYMALFFMISLAFYPVSYLLFLWQARKVLRAKDL